MATPPNRDHQIKGQFAAQPIQILESPPFRVLSRTALAPERVRERESVA